MGEPKKPKPGEQVAGIGCLLLIVAVTWVYCASDKPEATDEEPQGSEPSAQVPAAASPTRVTEEMFAARGLTWPLTVSEGVVACQNGIQAYFVGPDGTSYGLNGYGINAFGPLEPIWAENPDIPGTRINISDLLDVALSLCSPTGGAARQPPEPPPTGLPVSQTALLSLLGASRVLKDTADLRIWASEEPDVWQLEVSGSPNEIRAIEIFQDKRRFLNDDESPATRIVGGLGFPDPNATLNLVRLRGRYAARGIEFVEDDDSYPGMELFKIRPAPPPP